MVGLPKREKQVGVRRSRLEGEYLSLERVERYHLKVEVPHADK